MSAEKSKVLHKKTSLEAFLKETLETDRAFAEQWAASRLKREIAAMLCCARTRAGLSASQLAERAGWDRATVSRLESASGGTPEAETIDRYLVARG